MKIIVYMSTAKYHWERDVLRRWHDGIVEHYKKAANPDVSIDYEYGDRPVRHTDVGIVYGGARYTASKGQHDIRRQIMEGCKTFIINETPLLGRTLGRTHKWHRVGVNGHLNAEGDFNSTNKPGDRIQRYSNDWNLKFSSWQTRGEHIVLALQLPGDSSLRRQDLADWAVAALQELLEHTDRPIRIRIHPLMNDDDHGQLVNLYKFVSRLKNSKVVFSQGNEVPWDQDLQNCYCVVTYSSGMGIDAVDNGIPVIAMDSASFVYDISSRYIHEINNLKYASEAEKKNWYNSLSYSQWSSDEILDGIVWRHLLPVVESKLKDFE